MGCDGGTIPRRDELVRTKKKPEQVDKNAENVAKWKHCAISQEPLRKPIVSCELGRLYNKENVIKHLLNKDVSCEISKHIVKLSDVKELNLTEKNNYEDKTHQKGDVYVDFHDSRFICPVTALDMNGTQRFNFLWKCGCVLSERAIKEVKSETCHKCGLPFSQDEIIIINGTEEEISELEERMVERRRKVKLDKKKKKSASMDEPMQKKIKLEPNEPSTSKVESNGVNNHKGKVESNGVNNHKTVKTEANKKSQNGSTKSRTLELPEKAQKSYSIAKDPAASAAFKSLFTSHKTAKNQQKAHWVTHNPLYF